MEKNIQKIEQEDGEYKCHTDFPIALPKLERILLGKQIIEDTMKKKLSSLNQKNKPAQEDTKVDDWSLL